MHTDYVYLIHFAQPISERHTCQHYLGSAEDVDKRLHEHLQGKGARLTQVALERGIDFQVVRVWKAEPGQGRQLERKLKQRKAGPQLCPICATERRRQRNQLSFMANLDQAAALDFTLADVTEMAF